MRITVEGHADERGTREYNLALGARRAAATRDYPARAGVSANRMKTISYGKERPVAVCDDISCWTQNRRAVTVAQRRRAAEVFRSHQPAKAAATAAFVHVAQRQQNLAEVWTTC